MEKPAAKAAAATADLAIGDKGSEEGKEEKSETLQSLLLFVLQKVLKSTVTDVVPKHTKTQGKVPIQESGKRMSISVSTTP